MEQVTAKKYKLKKYENAKEALIGFLMACGPFVGWVIFGFLPMAISLYLSFTYMPILDIASAEWVGLENYIAIFKDESGMMLTALANSLTYCLSVPINMGISLFIANFLRKKLKGTTFVRSVLLIPSVCSTVGVTLMWSWILDNYGVINVLLTSLGLNSVGFISDANWFMSSVLLISAWQNGTNIILMQSALSNIKTELCEAARIDGANDLIVFWKVIVPCITPTLFYLFIMQTVAAMQEMGIMQIISGNGFGPGNKAVTLSYYMYLMTFNFNTRLGLGMASALGWVVAIVMIIFTKVNFKLSDKWVCYD